MHATFLCLGLVLAGAATTPASPIPTTGATTGATTGTTTGTTTGATAANAATANTATTKRSDLPDAAPPTAGTWSKATASAVELLPMVPSGHAARLYALYVGGSFVGAMPPGGSLIGTIYPTPAFSDFSGAGACGRLDAGVLWRRWLRAYATVEAGAALPGTILPAASTVSTQSVGIGGQFGAADAPWEITPFFGMSARVRSEELAVGTDRFVSGVFAVAQTFGVELRLDSTWVVRGGIDATRVNFGAFGGGSFVDRNGARWDLTGGIPGERTDFGAFLGVVYEAVRQ